MAGRVYVSFLGTSNYVEFIYKIDGTPSSPTRFVQEALVERYCKDWGKGDAILIFATTKAKKKNWKKDGHEGETNDLYNQGLEKRFNMMALNADLRVDCIKIPEVESQEDIWELFDIVHDEIKNYKHIHFDITHAYRFIPMFAMSLFNYSQFVNGTEVVWVKYAMLDNIGDLDAVRKTPLKDRDVQTILDLTSLIDLQDYTQIASDLKNFGKVKKLTDEIKENETIKNENVAKQFTQAINNLDEYISTIQISKIKEGKYMGAFKCNVKNAKKDLSNPIREIIRLFEEKTKDFDNTKTWKNVEAAIQWAKEYDMLIQMYALAEEYIISRVAEHFTCKYSYIKDPDNKDKKFYRKFIGSILSMPEESVKKNDFKNETSYFKNETSEILSLDWVLKLRIPYDKLRMKRNSLAHGNGSFDFSTLKTEFEIVYADCMSVIKENCD